jgi:YVTN family beta-propeller protein
MIPGGQPRWGIALTSEAKKLYVRNGLLNDVSVIDVQTNQVVKTLKVGNGPSGIAIQREQ